MNFGAARERRRSLRLRPAQAKALCSVLEGDQRVLATLGGRSRGTPIGGLYAVQDLSRSGVLLEGARAVQPGTRVSLRVMLPGATPLRLRGRVVRLSSGPRREARVAVGFSSVSPEDEDRIADWLAHAWYEARGVVSVVAATSLRTRTELVGRLRLVGARVVRARMPIELIHRLEGSRDEATVVFLGATLGGCSDEEVGAFLAAAYPRVRRVSVGAHDASDGTVRSWAHATMEPPWEADALEEQLSGARSGGRRSETTKGGGCVPR